MDFPSCDDYDYVNPQPLDPKIIESFWEKAGIDLFFPNFPEVLRERGLEREKVYKDYVFDYHPNKENKGSNDTNNQEDKDKDDNDNNQENKDDPRDKKRVRTEEPIDPYAMEAYLHDDLPDYPAVSDDGDTVLYDPCDESCVGKQFGVLSVLSNAKRDYLVRVAPDGSITNDRVEVGSLSDKHFMVYCFHVPVQWNHGPAAALEGASTELKMDCSRGCTVINIGDDKLQEFEIVVVAKMRRRFDDDEAAFNRFVSGFPNCLTVPFDDKVGRDKICKSLGCDADWQGLVFGPDQVLLLDNPCFVSSLGLRDAFPFKFKEVGEKLFDFQKRNRSLEAILDCKLTDTLHKNTIGAVDEGMPISVLRNKVVGLYVCREIRDSRDLVKVDRIYQRCRGLKGGFEIVLVHDPLFDRPKSFQEHMSRELGKLNIAWWVLPFNNTVRHRLSNLCGGREDMMIIVGPRGKYIDEFGLQIMMDFGVEAYPFTREALVKEELKRLRALTVDSLFRRSKGYLLHQKHGRANVKDFPRKNVAVCLGCVSNSDDVQRYSDDSLHSECLIRWHQYVKENLRPDFEMVFVGLGGSSPDLVEKLVGAAIPWYVCPFDIKHSTAVSEKIFGKTVGAETIITFGQDGKICSLAAQDHMHMKGNAALTVGNLLPQVMQLFRADDLSRCPYLAF